MGKSFIFKEQASFVKTAILNCTNQTDDYRIILAYYIHFS